MAAIDDIANAVYSERNIERAGDYLSGRGLDPAALALPWTATGGDPGPFRALAAHYPLKQFLDCLFIPVPDFRDPSGRTLAGFDARHIGSGKGRLRYVKMKRDRASPMVYGMTDPLPEYRRLVYVVESAIDAETLRQAGRRSVSPLSALASGRWALFLAALADKVIIAYDNDDTGRVKAKRLQGFLPEDRRRDFRMLVYRGKDVNEALELFGADYVERTLKEHEA